MQTGLDAACVNEGCVAHIYIYTINMTHIHKSHYSTNSYDYPSIISVKSDR